MDFNRRQFIAGASIAGLSSNALANPASTDVAIAPAPARKPYRTIAVEEAFATPEQFDAMKKLIESGGDYDLEVRAWAAHVADPGNRRLAVLLDMDGERLAEMDRVGLDMQVLSLTSPGVQAFDADTAVAVAEIANDRLAEVCRRHPGRFAGLASIAPQAPERAAKEIERAMTTLGLNGIIVNSHTGGEYLDAPKFAPILEAAAATGAAIYIHPRLPPKEMAQFFTPAKDQGKLENGQSLSKSFTTLMGFTAETLLHGTRLLVAGAFDRYPNLKIVLGHMGEGLPFLSWKLDSGYEIFAPTGLKRKPSEYLRENFVFSTSGFFSPSNAKFILEECGPQSLMFGVDYPYYSMEDGMKFLSGLELESSAIERISHLNAESVFKIARQE